MRKTRKTPSTIETNATGRSPKYIPLLCIAAILVLGALVYSNSFDCAFQFDDNFENAVYHDLGSPGAIWNYNPRRFVATYSFALNYHFNHFTVFGYHVVNIVIHLANALLVWVLALLILSTPAVRDQKYARHKQLIALGCGLLFVSHPMQTEAVTYIVQRLASLAAFFYFSAMIGYLKGRMSSAPYGKAWFLLAGIAATLGMLTKETTLTLPLMIILFEFSLFRTGTVRELLSSRKTLAVVIPLVIITLTAPLILAYDQENLFAPVSSSRFGDPPLSSGIYLMTQFRVVATYVRLIIFPVNQNIDYDFPASHSMFEMSTLLSFLFLAGILGFAVWLFRRNRVVSLGIFWFFLTLAVESSIKPIEDVIFEHRLYLPLFGFALAFVGSIAAIPAEKVRKTAIMAVILFIAANSALAFKRNEVWKTDIALWSDAVRKSPLKARPHYILGACCFRAGDNEKAKEEYRKALDVEPRLLDALLALGAILQAEGNNMEAKLLYERAIQESPRFSMAYVHLGNLYRLEQNYDAAGALFGKAAQCDPANSAAYLGLGRVFSAGNDLEKAKEYFRHALSLNPSDSESWYSLGYVFIKEKNIGEAQQCFLRVVEITPNDGDAICNLGNTYLEQGDTSQAVRCYERAIQIDPGNQIARTCLISAQQYQNR